MPVAENSVLAGAFVNCPDCRRAFPAGATVCSIDGAELPASVKYQPTQVSKPSYPVGELAPGAKVGDYVIEALVGTGGMGAVYRAVHPVIGSRVAIKVISEGGLRDRNAAARFVQEACLANQIGHPSIVDVFTFGELDDGRVYCVMEYLEGVSLWQYLRQVGRMTLARTVEVLSPVGRALDAAHRQRVIHRDIKPGNIFLVRDRDTTRLSSAKLLDFGIAKLLDTQHAMDVHTQTGTVVGTPSYMPPEQCRGKEVGPRSDVYALGVVAYEMLTGVLPFQADSLGDLLLLQQTQPPRPPSQLAPELPRAVDAVLARALHRDAEQRYEKPSQLVTALAEAAMPAARGAATLPMRGRRRPAIVALGLAGVVGIAGAIVAAWPRDPSGAGAAVSASAPSAPVIAPQVETEPPAAAPIAKPAADPEPPAPSPVVDVPAPVAQRPPARSRKRAKREPPKPAVTQPAPVVDVTSPPVEPPKPRRDVVPDMPVKF